MTGSRPVILDIEASGFGRGSYPIEIGVALPDERTHCYLIRPDEDWTHWDPAAEAVHRIRRDILVSRGRPVTEVADQLNAVLEGCRVYSDAWGQDSSWLALLFEHAGRPQRFRLEPLLTLMTEAQLVHWHATRRDIEEQLAATRHRASVDALVIQRTFAATLPPAV
ncbi:MAG: hypothetical protein U1F52_09620 [Burkholderiales bacterium]